MIPEEVRVIDAAIAWANCHELFQTEDVREALMDAVDALERARAAADPLKWWPATWADVRDGDTVRLPGHPDHPREVNAVQTLGWHVDPKSSEYQPRALEHARTCVVFTDGAEFDFPADQAIEIRLTTTEHDAMQLLGGWDNRL